MKRRQFVAAGAAGAAAGRIVQVDGWAPTAGAPNRTLTLIALNLRLSDHLKTVV